MKDIDRVKLFFPIALANFHCMIITNILATRLVSVASEMISPQQVAFIKGRSIVNCIVTTSENLNILDTKNYAGNMAIKFDIHKAFDTLDWRIILGY